MDKAAMLKAYIRQLPKDELIDLFISTMRKEEHEDRIPVSIFKAPLSTLELVVKYMKEELGYSNKKIALTLNRSAQNIWITYRNAKEKHPAKLEIRKSVHDIPVSVFADKELSTLESAASYLKKKGMDADEIAKILHRSRNTIVTVLDRAGKKFLMRNGNDK